MNNKTFLKLLNKFGACSGGVSFVNGYTAKQAYEACENASHMLWCLHKLGLDRKTMVTLACKCGRLSLKYTKDKRVEVCYETVEAWTRGEATIEQVREARSSADAAAAADAAADARDEFVEREMMPVLLAMIEAGPHARREEVRPACRPEELHDAMGVA